MHESSLARGMLDAILAKAEGRVLSARGWIADTEAIDERSLRFHFEAHARGTLAEGARLDVTRTLVRARCDACGEFEPDHHVSLALCPRCGAPGTLLGRIGLGIDSIEVAS